MNEFSDLEAELKQLRPAPASDALALRVARALADTPAAGVLPRRKAARFGWLSLGLGVATAAAAFLFLARLDVDQATPGQPTVAALDSRPVVKGMNAAPVRTLMPEGVTRVVYSKQDEGLVFPVSGGQPVRRLRARAQETLQWRDANTGASLRVSYPTEEVELIPAAGQ